MKDIIRWDPKLPGFGQRTRESGTQRFVVQYKIGKQQRRVTLRAGITREAARKEAQRIFGKVAVGEDPQGERRAARAKAAATDTFRVLADRFIEFQAGRRRHATVRATKLYLLTSCARLHQLKLDAITRREVASVLDTIARTSGAPSADHARAAVSAFFAWAIGMGLADNNPVIGTPTHAGAMSRDRKLEDHELVAVWRALDSDDHGEIVKLLILTGQRRDEIARLRSVEVHDGVIDLPAERCKNGGRNVAVLVAGCPKDPAAPPRSRLAIRTPWNRLRWLQQGQARARRQAEPSPRQLRDIRRTVATGMADIDIEPHIIEAVLNHQSGSKAGVAGIYNKATYQPQKTAALGLWANYILSLVDQASGGNVRPLRRPRRG